MGQANTKEDTHISANSKKTLRGDLRGRNPKVLMLDCPWPSRATTRSDMG